MGGYLRMPPIAGSRERCRPRRSPREPTARNAALLALPIPTLSVPVSRNTYTSNPSTEAPFAEGNVTRDQIAARLAVGLIALAVVVGFAATFRPVAPAAAAGPEIQLAYNQASLTWIQDILLGLALVAACWAAFEAWRAANSAIEGNRLTREATIAEHRPWIVPNITPLTGLTWNATEGRIGFRFVLENVGRTPARDVMVVRRSTSASIRSLIRRRRRCASRCGACGRFGARQYFPANLLPKT